MADIIPPEPSVSVSFDSLPDKSPETTNPPNQSPSDSLDLPDRFSPLETTFHTVSQVDPARAAKVTSLSSKLGEPEKYIDKNLDQISKVQTQPPSSFFSELEANYPGSTKTLTDAKIMAATHDDIQNIPLHESLVQRIKKTFENLNQETPYEADQYRGRQAALTEAGVLIKDPVRTSELLGKAAETGALQEELAFLNYGRMSGQGDAVSQDFFRFGSTVANVRGFSQTSAAVRMDQINKRLEELQAAAPGESGFKKGLSGAIEFLPQIAGGLLSGAKYAAPAAAVATAMSGPGSVVTAPVAAGFGFTAGESEYNYKLMSGMAYNSLSKVTDVNGNPLSENVKTVASIGMGAAAIGMNFVKLGAVLDTVPGGKDFLAKFTAETSTKVLENPTTYAVALKNFTQQWAKSTAHGVAAMEGITAINLLGTEAAKAVSPGEFAHPSASDVGHEFLNTAIDSAFTFGVLGLPGTSVSLGHDLIQAKKTEAAKDFYTALGSTAAASKLRERLPESHRDFIDTITKDSPVENIYVAPEALEQYFQSKKIDTPTVMAELGVTSSYEEAKKTGEKIKIPLSTWTDKVVGTEHYNGLADDISFNQNDLSVKEYAQKRADIKDAAAKAQGEVQKTADSESAALQDAQNLESGKQVYTEVSNLLKSAGLSQKEVEVNPKLQEAFFKTLGQKIGEDPYELFKQFPLSVNDVPAGFEKSPLEDVRKLTPDHIATPEEAIKNIGTRERANQMEAMLHEQAISAQERIDAAGGRKNARNEDIRALKESSDSLNKVRAIKDRLPQEKEFNQKSSESVVKMDKNGELKGEINGKGSVSGQVLSDYDFWFQDDKKPENYSQIAILEDVRVDQKSRREGTGSRLVNDFVRAAQENGADAVFLNASPNGVEGRTKKADLIKFYKSLGFKVWEDQGGNAVMYKEIEKQKELSQSGDTKRGAVQIAGNSFNIKFLEGADKTTFLHETGHTFLEVIGKTADKLSGMDKLSDGQTQVLNDSKSLLNWLGVESWDKVGRDQHEKFAEGFEKYLSEGKAPSPELQSAFQTFKKWLVSVYKSLTNIYPQVVLTPEVKGVLDRMLATDEEISRAQDLVGYKDEVSTAAPSDAKSIQALQDRARGLAEETLLKEQMPETTKEHAKFIEDTRARLAKLASVEVNEEPIFKAAAEIKSNTGNPYEAARKFLGGKMRESNVVKFEVAAELHGFASGKDLATQLVEADSMQMFDKAVQQKVEAGMANVADIKDTAAIRTKALEAIHNEKSIELLALESQALSKLILQDPNARAEISSRKRVEARVEAQLAKESARGILADKPIKDSANPATYITAERNAAVRVSRALDKGDFEAAAKAKREQLLNHALVAEAIKNKKEVDSKLEYFKQFQDRGQDLKEMPYGFIRQIDSVLSKFGLKQGSVEDLAAITAIANKMLEGGEDVGDIANATGLKIDPASGGFVPETLPDLVTRVNENYYALTVPRSLLDLNPRVPKDLKLQDLREVYDGVKAISTTGKKYDRYLGEFETMDIKKAAAEMRLSVETNVGNSYEEKKLIGKKYGPKWKEKIQSITSIPDAIIPSLVNMVTITDVLDYTNPDGPATKNIYTPLKRAEDFKIERQKKAASEIKELIKSHYGERNVFKEYKETEFYIPEVDRKMSRDEILSMALNFGNEGNKDRLRRGFGLDDATMQTIMERHLEKKDFEFVQDVWKHLQTYWPEIVDLEQKVNGVTPKGVEPVAFTNKFGTYEGGYYPIAYDPSKSSDAYKNAQEKNAIYKQYSAARAQTDSGHTEVRASNVQRAVHLSTNVLFNHIDNVIHDLAFRPAIIDVSRFLAQRDTKAAIENSLGQAAYRALGQQLKSVASDQGEFLNTTEKMFQWFRYSATFSTLAARIITLPGDIIGNFSIVAQEIGFGRASAVIGNYAATEFGSIAGKVGNLFGGNFEGKNEIKEFVESKSTRMKNRSTLIDRDIMEISKKFNGRDSAIAMHAFFFQKYADELISIPLWHEVYQRNLAEHGEQNAIDMADRAVTQAVGSGSKLDQAGIQQGSEAKKVLTMYYSWAGMMFNRGWKAGKISGLEYNDGNVGAAIGTVAKATVYLWLLPALGEAVTREYLRNNQGDDREKKKQRFINRVASQPFGYVPGVRDMASFVIDKATGQQGSNYKMSALESSIETVLKTTVDTGLLAFSHKKQFNQRYAEDVARSASIVLGYPQQANSMLFNFIDYLNHSGEASWRDAIQRRTKN